MKTPEDIEALDHRPGREWTADEVARMRQWWLADSQQRLVWLAATRYMGSGVTREDIEDAWGAYYAEEMERSRLSYRPGGPGFVTYSIHVCFKRECVRRGREIRKRRDAAASSANSSGEEWSYEDRVAADGPDPYAIVEQNAAVREIACFLEETTMPLQHTRAFYLKHFEQMSYEEIAWELQAAPGTVRVWVHRAAVRVQEHLRKKGWLS